VTDKAVVNAIAAVIIVIAALFVVWFVVDNLRYTPNTSGSSGGFSMQPVPRFILEDGETRADTPLLGSSTAYYDVYVRNLGNGGGYVTVHARMTQGRTAVNSEQTRWVNAGERVIITFEFREYSRWSGEATFRAWM